MVGFSHEYCTVAKNKIDHLSMPAFWVALVSMSALKSAWKCSTFSLSKLLPCNAMYKCI